MECGQELDFGRVGGDFVGAQPTTHETALDLPFSRLIIISRSLTNCGLHPSSLAIVSLTAIPAPCSLPTSLPLKKTVYSAAEKDDWPARLVSCNSTTSRPLLLAHQQLSMSDPVLPLHSHFTHVPCATITSPHRIFFTVATGSVRATLLAFLRPALPAFRFFLARST